MAVYRVGDENRASREFQDILRSHLLPTNGLETSIKVKAVSARMGVNECINIY